MPNVVLLALSLVLFFSCSSRNTSRDLTDKKTVGLLPTEKQPELMEVARFENVQPTGLTVTKDDRIFVSFPRWRENVPFSVVELLPDGTQRPYPDEEWNQWDGSPRKNRFTCVQSIIAHKDHLYVLDPSSPEMKGVVGKATLYRFDLKTNRLDKT
jgi:hypothetical protein